jgi:hypothetical protein
VTADALRQLFNSAIIAQYPQYGMPNAADPLSLVNLHSEGGRRRPACCGTRLP